MKNISPGLIFICAATCLVAQNTVELSNDTFRVRLAKDTGAVVMLEKAKDPNSPNFVIGPTEHPEFSVADSRWFGDLVLRYRIGAGDWKHASTARSANIRHISQSDTAVVISYSNGSGGQDEISGMELKESYEFVGDGLVWSIELKNESSAPLEIGDLGLPLLFNSYYDKDPIMTYTHRVIRHSYIEGDNSYIFWMRPDGIGPMLLMTPANGTHLEYYNADAKGDFADAPDPVFVRKSAFEGLYTAYIHGKVQAEQYDRGGGWRLPLTSRVLNPKAQAGSDARYQFVFHWANDYAGIRLRLFNEGLVDTEVAPGMVIPRDLEAHFSLRSKQNISSVQPEFPSDTTIIKVSSSDPQRLTYVARFRRLGENRISIGYGNGLRTQLEFFVTEPIDVMIQKRAHFLVANQQILDPQKWYDGEFSLWNMETRTFQTPDNVGELDPYMVGGSDDPDLCKAPYVAAKNILYPNGNEIAAVEKYIEAFVWGKLQRTDKEMPLPYGIYGTPSWHKLRNSKIGMNSGGNGREHMWRTFDYTHLIQLYFEMYRIAKLYPQLVHKLAAEEYLSRAYGTTRAFFQVPYQIKMGAPWEFRGWTDWAYKQGNFHEVFIPDLIDALESEGRLVEAKAIRTEWERKVLYFLFDHPYPFGSEMYFDTTAFESTHALSKYAEDHTFSPLEASWTDKNTNQTYRHSEIKPIDVSHFMTNEIRANTAARGNLETSYYQLGSDIRQGGNSNYLLSYMTQMGGWSILDYASEDPLRRIDLLRLGYASYLAGWADINSGDAASNFGFWFPGQQNDGAAGWAFNPQKVGSTWISRSNLISRGLWPYDGEIDSGFSGALRAAAVFVVRDPIFGLMAYGGDVADSSRGFQILSKDGVRQRIELFVFEHPIEIQLDTDHFRATVPLSISKDASEITLVIERTEFAPSRSQLIIKGLPVGHYTISNDNSAFENLLVAGESPLKIDLKSHGSLHRVEIRRVERSTHPE